MMTLSNNATIPTEDQLKSQWGARRFVEAMRILSEWSLDKTFPVSDEQMEELLTKSEDAVHLLASNIYYASLSP